MRYAKTKIAALAAAVVATASLPLLGDVTATYTAGATSLADGKITFAYDGSGNVTELRMRSNGNETLTLTGAPLVFADGARIVPGQNTNVIENAWTAAGELALGVTNMVWSGDADLSSDDWTTVLTGVRLDDISPVGAIRVRNSTRYSFAPYVVERGDGTLTVEFQYKFDGSGNNNNKYLQCGKVELKQDGDDVKARIAGSGYFGANDTGDDGHHKYVDYIGWSMFGSPAFTVTQNAYTFKELAFAPRRETYDYTNGLLTASFETVVARNVFVEDLEILYGAGGYRQSLGGAFGRATLTPRHVKLEDGVLSAQMVYAQSASRSKCVKVELRQSGSDVVARVAYAKYNSTNDPDFDFDDEASKYTSLNDGWHDYTLATDYSINGYGIDMLALRRKSPDRVAFKVSGEKTLGAMSGNGVEVGFAAAAGGAEVMASGANTMTDSAYVISGSGDADMTFTCNVANALPDGTVDVYGEGTKLAIKGKSQANAAITMHPGSELVNDTVLTAKLAKDVVLDAATLTMSKYAYVNDLTFLNGSEAGGTLRVGYTAGDGNWKVSGTGVSICGAAVNLYGANASGERWLTIDVADTVAGAGVDFIVSGAIATADRRYPYVSFVKAGEGTMRMDGSMATLTNLPVRVVAGVLAITTPGAVDAKKGRFSLEGGAIEFADGTANAVSGVTLTESAEISVGAGATLTIGSLTVPDGATLALSGDVLNGSVRVTSALDDTTLSRIRLNGKRAVQSSSGRLCTRGLIVSFY